MMLRIYVREGCHLCDEAVSLARELARGNDALSVEEIDIESADDLHRRYLEAIPVVELGGIELLRLDQFRDGGLERALGAIEDRRSDTY
ncbi:MAG: glutaredoxin family protein [Solirubrobacterales bacterium]